MQTPLSFCTLVSSKMQITTSKNKITIQALLFNVTQKKKNKLKQNKTLIYHEMIYFKTFLIKIVHPLHEIKSPPSKPKHFCKKNIQKKWILYIHDSTNV